MSDFRSDKPDDWLNKCAKSVYSQFGEDGIIERILDTIHDSNGWCVEFGAWDGIRLSNTAELIKNRGYSGVLIEGDSKRFRVLRENYWGNPNVTAINATVGWGPGVNLDSILSSTAIPIDFDVLSIDVDGNDYHIWKSVSVYHPRIVIVEYNPTIPNNVEFVQPAERSVKQGCSILSLCKLAKEKGYELVATTFANAFFVDSRYYGLFHIKDNSPSALRKDESAVTQIFSGFDGTVFLSGYSSLFCHQLPCNLRKVQQLPAFLRKYPGDYDFIRKWLFGLYSYLRKRGFV